MAKKKSKNRKRRYSKKGSVKKYARKNSSRMKRPKKRKSRNYSMKLLSEKAGMNRVHALEAAEKRLALAQVYNHPPPTGGLSLDVIEMSADSLVNDGPLLSIKGPLEILWEEWSGNNGINESETPSLGGYTFTWPDLEEGSKYSFEKLINGRPDRAASGEFTIGRFELFSSPTDSYFYGGIYGDQSILRPDRYIAHMNNDLIFTLSYCAPGCTAPDPHEHSNGWNMKGISLISHIQSIEKL